MTIDHILQDELLGIGTDTVAVVTLFEQGHFAEASLRAGFIGAAAQRMGLSQIQQAASAFKLALRPQNGRRRNSVDTGLTALVEAVERASSAAP